MEQAQNGKPGRLRTIAGDSGRPAAILIAGPTASGKSGLALALAERLDGTIVNADSMQVYRDLRVLTARPSAADEARVPHRLYGHVDGAEAYSAGRWVREAADVIAAEQAAGRLPIVVGGTGLYFMALLDGLSPIPEVPEAIRARWRAEAGASGAAGLHRRLAELDPAMAARLAPTDAQRVTRALEVLDATGRSLAHWQALPRQPVLAAERTVRLVVSPDREALYHACDVRLVQMVLPAPPSSGRAGEGGMGEHPPLRSPPPPASAHEGKGLGSGALDEVAALMARRLDTGLPVMRALGVAPLARHLAGEIGLDEALAAAQLETRHYVKRQLTWLRRHMIMWGPVETKQMITRADEIVALIKASR